MVQYATYRNVMWQLEGSHTHTLKMDFPAVKLFMDSGFPNEGEGVDDIFLTRYLNLFLWKNHIRHKLLFKAVYFMCLKNLSGRDL